MQTLVLAWLCTLVVTLGLIRWRHWHLHLSADDVNGVQKFHQGQVPRIGGVAVAAGLAVALGWSAWRGLVGVEAAWLLLAAVPAWLAGLLEDVTKRVGVMARLLATMASAALAAWLLDALVPRLGIAGLDALLAWSPVAWALTLVAVAGVANAVNIIDGFHGLAVMVAMLMFAAFGYVAWVLGDGVIVQLCLAMIGALAGFFFWNYPRGLIFLGDGGAYLVGFMLAEVAVLMVVRHPGLSPWFCLLVCLYPITETLFSIYRRLWLRGTSPGVPDGLHLHTLVYRRLIRWAAGDAAARCITARNAATSPYLWGLTSLAVIPAVLFWRNEVLLQLSAAVFIGLYVGFYAMLVRFRSPPWLRRRVHPRTGGAG